MFAFDPSCRTQRRCNKEGRQYPYAVEIRDRCILRRILLFAGPNPLPRKKTPVFLETEVVKDTWVWYDEVSLGLLFHARAYYGLTRASLGWMLFFACL